MNKDQKDLFKSIAHDLMFDLSEEELESMEDDFTDLLAQLALLDEVDTTDVVPMVYPFEEPTTYLREDKVNHVISKEAALANAKNVIEDMIVVPKVVK